MSSFPGEPVGTRKARDPGTSSCCLASRPAVLACGIEGQPRPSCPCSQQQTEDRAESEATSLPLRVCCYRWHSGLGTPTHGLTLVGKGGVSKDSGTSALKTRQKARLECLQEREPRGHAAAQPVPVSPTEHTGFSEWVRPNPLSEDLGITSVSYRARGELGVV